MKIKSSNMTDIHFIEVTPQNIQETTPFCIKDPKNPAYHAKIEWYTEQYKHGSRMLILEDDKHRKIGYIEFTNSENAWRPVSAKNFIFIQCMYIYAKKDKGIGLGSQLIKKVEEFAIANKKDGIVTMCSKGSWIANKSLFEKNGFKQVDKKGRFELMMKSFTHTEVKPHLIDWSKSLDQYQGWHILYSDQCPWKKSSVDVIVQTAKENGIEMKAEKIETAQQAQNGPSGFGTFALIHKGKLLEDHYISKTRFVNILKKEIEG